MGRVTFKINNVEYSVGDEITSDVMLVDYIRNHLELRGTKYMCRQAGCGACIVAAVKTSGLAPVAVNSCMVSITSCQDWEITTIEEVGNRRKGYHVVQKTLAKYNGTQCGYCSPGWVMAMFSLLQSNKNLTMMDIEKSFASNVCRCTGYRSILEAFKQFAKDVPKQTIIDDIEDLCLKNSKICKEVCDNDWCVVNKSDVTDLEIVKLNLRDNKKWFQAKTITHVSKILEKEGKFPYQLVAGNTAKGVYPIDEYPPILIDVSGISELKGYFTDQNLVIRAGTTLTELLEIFKLFGQQDAFQYLNVFYKHLELVAHIAVRNIGTIAGNLMIKHQHNEFPSDVFLMLETVGAEVTILNSSSVTQQITMQKFLATDMKKCIILNVLLPPLSKNYKIQTYKVTPRAQNAHAVINAGFLYKLNKFNTVEKARIVYGNLSSSFTRAADTERYLIGKKLFTNDVLQAALKILDAEIVVNEMPPDPSAAYRKKLALCLFYKGLLSLAPEESINGKYRSGITKIREIRPVSEGKQIFNTNPKLWPLNQPIPKMEALIQCAGEAQYAEDLPAFPKEVFGTFVLSTIPKGFIVSIDPSRALKISGVLAFYTAKDIPGLNSFTPADEPINQVDEEILSSGEIKYYNQPIAIMVAETRHTAELAAKLIDVKYDKVGKPVTDVQVAKKESDRTTLLYESIAKKKGDDIYKVVKGSNTVYGQYHYTMELISCVTRPTEEGLEVHATSQWMDNVQVMISRALNIQCSRIDVHVRRLGGAYGIKISRSTQVAVACSLVVQKLNRPCRFIQSMTTTTRAVGKRLPCSSDYEIGVNKSGVIQYCNYNLYEDNGYVVNEKLASFCIEVYNNVYGGDYWNFKLFNVTTDTPSNTFFRAPGTLATISLTEHLLENLSYELSLDPVQIRLANLDPLYGEVRDMAERLLKVGQYYERRDVVTKFNRENRWKKRGLRFCWSRFKHFYPRYFDVNMSVYHGDGSVAIVHGGVEIGQGINTKAAQVAAYLLNISLDKVVVKAINTVTSPNCAVTGGSLTTQNIIIGVRRCCEELLMKLEPVKKKMENATWESLIKEAFDTNVDLQCHGFVSNADMQDYQVYGAALAEVEIDVLTGEYEVLRVDILQDAGMSISPEIDVGQVEGAFVMGLGFWTCEELVYDHNTGELLTDRTWNYYVPQAKDIPQDFRVYFRNNSYTNQAIFGSKSIGEPPICVTAVVPFAIREALVAARAESGLPSNKWFSIDGPYTIEKVGLACENKLEDFKFI